MNYTKSVNSVSQKTLEFNTDIESIEVKDKICPLSGDKGLRLLKKTLANHVYPKFWKIIDEKKLYFCSNTNCPIVYFNSTDEIYFGLDDLHSVVMHKIPVNTENRPACYCKNVLEGKILDELINKQCCDSLIDIQEFTGANTGKNCAITNPTGRCCGKQIKEIIEFAKESRTEIAAPLLEEAESCCAKIDENANNFYEKELEL